MKEYVNFYENLKEARRRIADTVVMYEGIPHYVLCISDHKSDGIFRAYLEPLATEGFMEIYEGSNVPYHSVDELSSSVGDKMDEYLDTHKDSRIIRKMLNSPKFNKFRPFPLGMCNYQGTVNYLTRTPVRPLTQQGLTETMIRSVVVDLNEGIQRLPRASRPGLFSKEFARTVYGEYPTLEEVIGGLKDPTVSSVACAFHREFAIVKGPIKTLFLAYRTDIIGILPNKDTGKVVLSYEFGYVKETIQELGIFNEVLVD
jgi:hypothetical protein